LGFRLKDFQALSSRDARSRDGLKAHYFRLIRPSLVATQLASEPVCLRNIRIAAEGSVFFFLIAPHTNGPRDLPWCGALEFT
jgi:hypothetical protein